MAAKSSEIEVPDYTDVRARLLQRGYTLRSFALKNGYCVQTVYSAARGRRSGIRSVKIVNQLKKMLYAQEK